MASAISIGVGLGVVHPPAGPVLRQPVRHVHLLLDVVGEREVQERPTGRHQLHRRAQTALDDGEVARGELPVQVRHVAPDLHPRRDGHRCRVDTRPAHHDHPQARHPPLRLRVGRRHPAQQVPAHPRAAHRDQADPIVGPVAELGAQLVAGRGGGRTGHVAGELEVRIVQSRTLGRPGPSGSVTRSAGLPTNTERSRSRGYRAICSIISAL